MKKIQIVIFGFIILILTGCTSSQILLNEECLIEDLIAVDEEMQFDLDVINKLINGITDEFEIDSSSQLILDNDNIKVTENGVKGVKTGKTNIYFKYNNKKVYIGQITIVDKEYSDFQVIKSSDEFLSVLTNSSGKFILGSDIDYTNIEFKSIDNFTGILINPYNYKLKNIGNCNLIFTNFNGYFEGLIFDNCYFTNTGSTTILPYIKCLNGIAFENCVLNVNDNKDSYETIDIILSKYINNFKFQGKIISSGKNVCVGMMLSVTADDVWFVSYNSSVIIDMSDVGVNSVYKFVADYAKNCYNVIIGDVQMYVDSFDGSNNYTNVERCYNSQASYLPEYRTTEQFLSGNADLFPGLDSYTFNVGNYPYIKEVD